VLEDNKHIHKMNNLTGSDLRPNNLFKLFLGIEDDGPKYRIIKLEGVKFEFGKCYYQHGATWVHASNNLEPIELNDYWFKLFLFHKWGTDHLPRTISYQIDWIQLFPANSFCDFEGYGFMHYKPDPDAATESARVVLKYVHELQNFMYSMRKKELEPINEPTL